MAPGDTLIGQVNAIVARAPNGGTLQHQGMASRADLQPGRRLARPSGLKSQVYVANANPIAGIQHRMRHPPSIHK